MHCATFCPGTHQQCSANCSRGQKARLRWFHFLDGNAFGNNLCRKKPLELLKLLELKTFEKIYKGAEKYLKFLVSFLLILSSVVYSCITVSPVCAHGGRHRHRLLMVTFINSTLLYLGTSRLLTLLYCT